MGTWIKSGPLELQVKSITGCVERLVADAFQIKRGGDKFYL